MALKDNMDVKKVIQAMNNDSLVLFVGAGISKDSGLPLWNELTKELKDDLNLTNGDGCIGPKMVAEKYYSTFGKNEYTSKINRIFSMVKHPHPNRHHKSIAKIAPKHIITTNYDELLEAVFDEGALKYEVITKDSDIPYSKADKYLIKMHGDLKNNNFVLKQSDYDNYAKNFMMVSTLIQSLLMNNTVLFIGYSLSDSTFNTIFELIHNYFGEDSKMAYFYTPDNISNDRIENLSEKGIKVISNYIEKDGNPSNLTNEFLQILVDAKDELKEVKSIDVLNKKLEFLTKLNFIDFHSIIRYAGVNLINYGYGNLKLFHENGIEQLKDNDYNRLNNILNKTNIKTFLGSKIKHKDIIINDLLAEGFELYKNKYYSQAKSSFRRAANEAIQRKDYFNYLVAEFNIHHIFENRDETKPDLSNPISDLKLEQIVRRLSRSLTESDRKIVEYFGDNILSFSFLYKTNFNVGRLLEKIKKERKNAENGGASWNEDLNTLFFEMVNLYRFINENYICVSHINVYYEILDKYLEALLISYSNSKIDFKSKFDPHPVSSEIKFLDVMDVKIITEHIDDKNLDTYIDQYKSGKIKLDDDAKNYLIDEITKFKDGTLLNHRNRFKQLLHFLVCVELDEIDLNKVLTIFSNDVDSTSYQQKNIVNFLKIFIDAKVVSDTLKSDLLEIVSIKLNNSLSNSRYIKQIPANYYRIVIEKCMSDNLKLNLPELTKGLLLLKHQHKLKELEKYVNVITCFFNLLADSDKNLIIDLCKEYEQLDELNYKFLTNLIINGVYNFDKIQEKMYHFLIKSVNEGPEYDTIPSMNAIKKEEIKQPDLMNYKLALGLLFDLNANSDKGIFSNRDKIISEINIDIKGIHPEVDWDWLNIKTSKVLHELVKKHGIEMTKKYFIKDNGLDDSVSDLLLRLLFNNSVN